MRTRLTALGTLGVIAAVATAAFVVTLIVERGGSTPPPPVAIAPCLDTPRADRVESFLQAKRRRAAPRQPHRSSCAHVPKAPAHLVTGVSLERMVGQQLMVRMNGTRPDFGLLSRIRKGEVGGVILYAENIASPAQTRSLVARLQAAARQGGNPPLLISTDQEGGSVKRLPWAPPDVAPPAMGERGGLVSRYQGERTGSALRSAGINVDLAPVVDVAHSASSFIWRQRRAFGLTASSVIDSAVPFAQGLELAGVAATAKHFPGVGGAATDTDNALETIISRPEDRLPYQPLIADQVPLIMVSTAIYPNLDPASPAALSRPIITGLLRGKMQYRGAVITDDLVRPTGHATAAAAIAAAAAGADIILVSTTEDAGAEVYPAMLAAAKRGTISRRRIEAAYKRIERLKQHYAT